MPAMLVDANGNAIVITLAPNTSVVVHFWFSGGQYWGPIGLFPVLVYSSSPVVETAQGMGVNKQGWILYRTHFKNVGNESSGFWCMYK